MRAVQMIAAAVALGLPAPCDAKGNDSARWITVDYREQQQVTIPCSSGLLCTISFARGELLGDYFISDPNHWKLLPAYSQNRLAGTAMGQLVVQAMTPGLRANMVIFARNSRRVYRLFFVSTKDARPLYASFVYPSPAHKRAVAVPAARPSTPATKLIPVGAVALPAPTPTPVAAITHIGDAACEANNDAYTTDSGLDRHGRPDALLMSLRPIRVCLDFGHVYAFMPQSDTAESDLPVPYEESAAGITQTNYHYYAADRVFVIDSVLDIVLRSTSGSRVLEMRLRRKALHG